MRTCKFIDGGYVYLVASRDREIVLSSRDANTSACICRCVRWHASDPRRCIIPGLLAMAGALARALETASLIRHHESDSYTGTMIIFMKCNRDLI